MKISVIICTHNPRLDYLTRTLDAHKTQSGQGIVPFQSGKTRKISVRGLQDQSPFNRQGSQMGVSGQVARRAGLFQQGRTRFENGFALDEPDECAAEKAILPRAQPPLQPSWVVQKLLDA